MRRITGANAPGGLFTQGATPADSTIVTAQWLNDVQETVLHTIIGAGITPGADVSQLTDAIAAMIAASGGGGGGGGGGTPSGGTTVIGAYQMSDDLTGPIIPTAIADSLVLVASMVGLDIFLAGVASTATTVRLRHMRAGASLADISATIASGARQARVDFGTARTITAGDYLALDVTAAGTGGLGLKARVLGVRS